MIVFLSAPSHVAPQPLGLGNDRAHPELAWQEFETEHFVLVYPKHLAATAIRAATIAEQVYGPVTRGLDTPMSGKTSIVLSDEDQIVNGFAYPGKMFLWVNQNDYAQAFSGTEKWLRKVIAHEFQHDVWFEAAMDWRGLYGLFGTPAWFVEGLAEYHTEEWGPYRSDLDVRTAILRNQHEGLDPHDSGFTKVRYMAEQYGDSVITRAVKERNWAGLSNFRKGFRETAGITLAEFDEEWRRAATAHTYALYAQKESVVDVGEPLKVPGRGLRALRFSPDGAWMCVLARSSRAAPPVLAKVRNDSTRAWTEIDHGSFDDDFAFSADGSRLVYAKRHRSSHGGIVWDLKVADLNTGETRWITSRRRASDPHWSPAGDRIVFTAVDGSTTNLYLCDPDGTNVQQLTQHADDVQVLSPRFSPDGKRIVFARFLTGRSIDLVVMDLESKTTRDLTGHRAYDLQPFWSQDGTQVFFTSDRNRDEVPNVFVVPAGGSEADVACVTDVGEAMYGLDVNRQTGSVVALAMASTDTSRVRAIEPNRRVENADPVIRPRFVSWRDRVPPHPIPAIDEGRVPLMTEPRAYRSWRHVRYLQWWVFPSPSPWGVEFGAVWTDIAHRHRVWLGLDVGSNADENFTLRGFYGNWETNRLPFGVSGTLTLSGGQHSRTGYRIYGGDLLLDEQNHFQARWRLPLNLGEHDYANHAVIAFADFASVDVQDPEDIDVERLGRDGLPLPRVEYAETGVGLEYRYVKMRPHARAFGHASTGHGLWLRSELADNALGGDLDYQRVSIDAAAAFRLPSVAAPFFARVRAQSVWGEPAPQDFTGLRADVPILPLTYREVLPVLSDVVDLEETYFVRGLPQNVPGEQALVATLEWRLPLVPPLPISAFGFRPGGLTGVVFYDHGRVWSDAATLARHTIGWEARLPLQLGDTVLLVPSYGEGQTLDWERDGAAFTRDAYFRIAMTQPF